MEEATAHRGPSGLGSGRRAAHWSGSTTAATVRLSGMRQRPPSSNVSLEE